MMSEISLIKRLNNRGPITLPCGMPLVIVQGYDSDEPTRTRWVRLERKCEIQDKRFPCKPYPESLWMSFKCDTESNALLKSM